MKKRFTILIAALMLLTMMASTGTMWGQERTGDSYTIEFNSTDGGDSSTAISSIEDIVKSGSEYITSITNTSRVYKGKNGYGVKLGASGNPGYFTMNLAAEGQGKVAKIYVYAAKYNSTDGGNIQISLNGKITTGYVYYVNANQLTDNITEYELTISSTIDDVTSIKIATTQKRNYVHSIKVEMVSTNPSCEVSPTSWAIGNVQAGSSTQTQSFTVTAANLTAGLSFEIENGAYYSITNGVTGMNSNETSKTIVVTFNPINVGDMNDHLVISGTDFSGENAIRVQLTAHGLCNAPTNELSYTTPVNLPLTEDVVSTTLTPTTNTGNEGSITYAFVEDYGSNATINSTTGAFQANAIGQYVVRASQALNGTTCGGEFNITINVTGTEPVCTIDPETYNFGTVLTGSANTHDFIVTTANLTGNLTVTIDKTDKGFSIVSPSPATIAQNATSTTVRVQYAPTTAGSEVTATLTISGGGITTQTATVKGTASDGNTITFYAGTGTCGTASVTNLPNYEFTLPTATAPEGWTFAGWCATNVSTATTIEPTLLTGSYIISGDATLYAVYSKTEGSGGNFEYVFKDQGYTNAQIIYSDEMDATSGIGWTATTGGNNEPAYYDTGTGLRVYNGGTFSITTNGNTITAVSLTFSSTSYTFSSSVTTNPTIWSGSQSTNITWSVSRTCRLQKVNVTYNNSTTTYHTSPTAKVATPTIEIAGVGTGAANTYYEKATVTLACDTDDATIHYTTNGDDPTEGSDTYAAPFDVTNDAVIKAIAVKTNYTNSNVTSPQTINIVHRNATFTVGVYSTLNSSATFNEWYQYSVTGSYTWSWDSYGYARIAGSGDNEAWLISPKMSVENGKLAVSFDCVGRYANENQFEAYYSTNYPGYGNPTSSTWTEISQVLPYAEETWTFTTINENLTVSGNVYFAFVYKSTTSKAGTLEVKNFTAKQCYPVTYNSNGGTGDMTDSNSPYAVGATVTTLANDFTAPEGKVFERWSDGENYYAANTPFTMPNAAVTLSAQWITPCTIMATMAATEAEAVYDYNGGDKRYNISISSSVSVLGGCDIAEYGFVYSTSETTPTIDNATKIAVGTEYNVANTEFEAGIENATTGTYYIRAFATNAAGTAYSKSAVTVVVPVTYPTWTITYYANDKKEETEHTVYQGATIGELLAAPTAANIPSGFTFRGWYNGEDYYHAIEAPTLVNVGDEINGDLNLKAVFAIAGTGEAEQNLEMTATNFTELLGSYGTYTHEYTDVATIMVYSCKQSNAFQVNRGKSVYFKNTTPMPGYITKFVINWSDGTDKNTITMYANGNSVASTSSTNVGEPDAGTPQTITIENASTNNYKYFYLHPETVSGGCKISSFNIYYMGTGTIYSNFCTSVESISGNENIDEETGILTDDVIVNEGVFYVDEIITVPDGKKLEITGTGSLISPVAENLIIEEGGQLIIPNNATVAATFIKNVPEKTSKEVKVTGWELISSPTYNVHNDGNPYENFSAVDNLEDGDGYLLYKYDEKERYWRSSQTTGHEYDKLYVAQGYLYGNSTGTAIEFTGNVNSAASYLVDLSYNEKDSDNLAGFNLIGNPFSHEIAWSNGVTLTGESISKGYYKIDGEGFSATLCTENIAPLQGILVKANATGQSVTFNNVMPLAKGEQANHDNIMFKVENSECSDVAYALFDKGYGLNKISHRGDMVPMLYIPQNGENYAIAMMDDNTNSFNLGFEAKTTAKYTLTYKAKGEFNYLHVIDRMTGEDIDMLLEGEYSFVGSPQDDNNRFIVRLGYLPNYDDNGEDTFAYQNGSDIVVSGEGELQIFDVMGRKVASITINGVETVNIPTQGVYIMKLNEKTQKIVVR